MSISQREYDIMELLAQKRVADLYQEWLEKHLSDRLDQLTQLISDQLMQEEQRGQDTRSGT